MAITIFVVRATIAKDKEAAFNKWYNEEHAPQVLQFNGAVSARRYRKILGEDKFQYMAVYEFASEDTFRRFQESDHLKTLIKDYNANFETTSERERAAYVQIWP
jgi:antibiotic biosynthesis monooxygenase (ABM) superfamily enzyme